MNDERFEEITRRLATPGISRRAGLKVIFGGVAGAALAGPMAALMPTLVGAAPRRGCNQPGLEACVAGHEATYRSDIEACRSQSGPQAMRCKKEARRRLELGRESCERQFCCGDTQSDVNNCGACGNVCPPGQPCVTGVCQQPCGGAQAACISDSDCCEGMICNLGEGDPGTCVVNCIPPESPCVAGDQCCSGRTCQDGFCLLPPACQGFQKPCSVNLACCDGFVCHPTTSTCELPPDVCRISGESCAAPALCCDGYVCSPDTFICQPA